ncbi:hypothetical protein acsn021_04090 [Anaerocolumna cellulosilytica]|uniref:Uncharacterized protein n=1 Tax=Anaerocolumna cellulosilytica TaxID=433286 RepID=A0A6S6R0M4_9FIRM|nr:hypothetical protein [Anaerocolumna cellulosilytica]MBB5197397.1 flagellin-specific chaperone FliS [Anaerocolumna cellulosilytica]BCJ92840.1 hypothetical protein acsn021_04090 [Anaerocolumna cellulosilytica]
MNEKQNIKIFSDLCRDCMEQNKKLIDYVEGSKDIEKVQIGKAIRILKRLRKSLLELQKEDSKLTKYIGDPVQYQLILKPYKELLEGIKEEINVLVKGKFNEPEH